MWEVTRPPLPHSPVSEDGPAEHHYSDIRMKSAFDLLICHSVQLAMYFECDVLINNQDTNYMYMKQLCKSAFFLMIS